MVASTHPAVQSENAEIREVRVTPLGLEGLLALPPASEGIVLFAHGSGSSRLDPRNNQVAEALRRAGMATLLLDLLQPEEAANRNKVFDVDLLAGRLLAATEWVREQSETRDLIIDYFGAGTGAATALVAAAPIGAVVSRGGRPDLAGAVLADVMAPTLLIVGGDDPVVLDLNRAALAKLRCEKRLEIVPRAGHLFEQPGALDAVIGLAREWFVTHLRKEAAA